jgi:hypothetical protein
MMFLGTDGNLVNLLNFNGLNSWEKWFLGVLGNETDGLKNSNVGKNGTGKTVCLGP